MQVGDHITELEGYDLGEKGAVVVRLRGDSMTLSILDSDKQITVEMPDEDQVAVQVDYEGEEPSPGVVDMDSIDSDELSNIRSLPMWWGPRDPNYPSTLTQVMWEPEPLWRRMEKRVWASSEENEMRRREGKRLSRRADYDPTPMIPEPDEGRQLGIGFNLPRRMRLDLWEERDGDALDTQTLMHLADEFWYGYRKKRWGYMPERGDRMNLPMDKYAQVFRRDLDLSVAEVQNLVDFMYVTRLVPEWEARMLADNFQLGYTYAWDRVDS